MVELFSIETARLLGVFILVGAIAIDFLLSQDDVEGNSIRDFLLLISRKYFRAATPYGIGLLAGHFYHPGTQGLIQLKFTEWGNPLIAIAIGIGLLIVNRIWSIPSSKHIFYIALFGLLVGIFIWPVQPPDPSIIP